MVIGKIIRVGAKVVKAGIKASKRKQPSRKKKFKIMAKKNRPTGSIIRNMSVDGTPIRERYDPTGLGSFEAKMKARKTGAKWNRAIRVADKAKAKIRAKIKDKQYSQGLPGRPPFASSPSSFHDGAVIGGHNVNLSDRLWYKKAGLSKEQAWREKYDIFRTQGFSPNPAHGKPGYTVKRPGAWYLKRPLDDKTRGEDLAIGASGAIVFGGIGGVALSRYHGKTLTGADLPKKKKKKGSKR